MRYVSRIIVIIFVYTLCTQVQAHLHSWKYIYTVDGDTIMFEALWMPSPLKKVVAIRIDGIDTPERHSRCEAERKLADKATQFVRETMATSRVVQVEVRDHDKFGGRLLGDVFYDGKSLSQTMLEMGYARPYSGKKKLPWCTTAQ